MYKVKLRRILYLLWKAPSRRHLGQISYPAQAKFVVGDYTIENSLHYVRDVTFGEDRSRLRTCNAPQVMDALRNLAITLIHRSGSFQIAETRRHFSYQPQEALAFLLPQSAVA